MIRKGGDRADEERETMGREKWKEERKQEPIERLNQPEHAREESDKANDRKTVSQDDCGKMK